MRLALLLLLAASCSPAAASQRISVHDGDTLTLNGQRWRLWGVDAPELGQMCDDGLTSCDIWSRDNLERLVRGHRVTCTPAGKSYDRLVGRCFAGDLDLSAAQVRAGWALDYRTYSRGAYAALEAAAHARRLGVWATEFVPPWEWRRTHRVRRD